jgi:hypothetical protein
MGYSYDFNSNFSDATLLTMFGAIIGATTMVIRYCFTSQCDINICYGCLHIERHIPEPIEPPIQESKSQDSNEISNKKNNIIYNKV